MTSITIAGNGIAELTCAWLLARRGHRIRLADRVTGGWHPLILNEPTLELLRMLWHPEQILLEGTWPLTHREVRWGPKGTVEPIMQTARVADGAQLAHRMRNQLLHHPATLETTARETAPAAVDANADAALTERTVERALEWTVSAEPPTGTHLWEAGRRHLLWGVAPLLSEQDEATARMDTSVSGWLHLTPLGHRMALLQAMVPGPVERPAEMLARMLTESNLKTRLVRAPGSVTALPAAPRLHCAPARAPTPHMPGHLHVGAGAIRFDPLSGTGTAQALRTAILAAAVIGTTSQGAPPEHLCAHYTARLNRAFRTHLRTCAQLYNEAFTSPDWRSEHDAMRHRPSAVFDTSLHLDTDRLLPSTKATDPLQNNRSTEVRSVVMTRRDTAPAADTRHEPS
ncbi:hypothetical protein ACFW9U_26695 [Rhodococcus aetherivorans]|uniref:hypothetical protein n=1 Tax=Rhodococcus aetherivorans TaxID=191292 RepID=UPI00366AA3FB